MDVSPPTVKSSLMPAARPSAVVIAHAAAFVAATVFGIVDGLSSPFGSLTSQLDIPMIGLAIGTIRARSRLPGWRPILAISDVGMLVAVASQVALPPSVRSAVAVQGVLVIVVLGALATLIAPASRMADGRSGASIERRRNHRLILVAIVAMAVVTVLAPVLALAGRSGIDVGQLVPSIVLGATSLAIVVVAWWWGSPWILAYLGLYRILIVVAYGVQFGRPILDNNLWLGLLEVGAAYVGPSLASVPTAEAAIAPDERRGSAPAVWLAFGAVLYVPFLFFGLFPPVTDTCLRCGVGPIGELVVAIDILSVAAVPIGVLTILALGSGSATVRVAGGVVAGLSGFVLAQILVTLVGVDLIWPFGPLAVATELLLIGGLTVGSGHRWLSGSSQAAALASVALGLILLGSTTAFVSSVGRSALSVAIVVAPLVIAGIAWESARASRYRPMGARPPTPAET